MVSTKKKKMMCFPDLHGVEGAGQAEEGREGNETEGNNARTDLELHEIADVVENALALFDGRPVYI